MITLCLSFLVLTPIVTEAFGPISWWVNVGLSVSADENYLNIAGSSLSPKQKMIVNKHNSPRQFLHIIAEGAKIAIIECQRQFKHRKWNCSSNNPYNVFGQILKIACRETAFAYAITAAAVSHSISKACAAGQLKTCTCDGHYKEGKVTSAGWEWSGCSDNIHYADKLAQRFLNSGERYRDFRTSVNIHNNEAGKTAVRNNMKLECKCHGLSKACTVKTCWKRIPDFGLVGTKLKEKFDGASKVAIKRNKQGLTTTFTAKDTRHKAPTHADLIYYEESPKFCTKNPRVGSLGTVGRVCNETSMGTDGCALMCCGRGYTSELKTEPKPCHCEFQWCCKVICKECNETKNVRICS